MVKVEDLLTFDDCLKMSIDEVHSLYRQFVNSGQVDLIGSFGPGRVLVKSAQGAKILTSDDREILDFTGGIGVLNHGHNHPEILAIRRRFQEEKRMEVHKNFLSPYVAALSANIAKLLPRDLKISYFCNSGAESVEGAIKLAFKSYGGKRSRVMSADISFHGKLLGTAGLTGSPEVHFKWPTIPNIDRFEYNNFKSIEELVRTHRMENGESAYYAILLEPFSASSLLESSPEFLRSVRELCDRENIRLIFDEVYTGWAKTGELFHFMHSGVIPDILTMSKSFGAGKASIAGFVARECVFKAAYGNLNDSILHSTTYNGFGEETVTALEGVRIMVRDNFPAKARQIESILRPGLERLKEKYPTFIKEIRGRGGLLGILFNDEINLAIRTAISVVPSDMFKDSRFIAKLITGAVISELFNGYGILSYFGSNREIPLIIAPPLVVEKEDLEYYLESLDKVLSEGRLKLIAKFVKYKFSKEP